MTEELQNLLLRSDAAIREAKHLIEVNEQLRIYSEDILERMRERVHFRPMEERLHYPAPKGLSRSD
jgi:hypothetical protein